MVEPGLNLVWPVLSCAAFRDIRLEVDGAIVLCKPQQVVWVLFSAQWEAFGWFQAKSDVI